VALIAEIDRLGGMVAAIEAGFPQREIERRAYEFQRDVEDKRRIVVGQNAFVEEGESAGVGALHRLDPAVERGQIERLGRWKASRDARAAQGALDALASAARGTANLVAATVDAVKAGATLGEIADVLRQIFGQHR
jgi:methylmalonyl-CoA mutase N-terminal domain/subunit